MIFSLGEPMFRGLNWPGLLFGIRTCLVGENLKVPFFSSVLIRLNHSRSIPSSVVGSTPGDIFPGFPLIKR